MHWMEAAGIILAIGLGKVWDAKFAHPKIKKERNAELDSRLNSLRTAIDVGHQSLSGEVATLTTNLRTDIATLSAHVIGPDGQNGLRGEVREIKTELAMLAPRKLVGRNR